MRLSRLHCEDELRVGNQLSLTADAGHYLLTVLRLKRGDRIRLFNERDGEFEGSIRTADKKQAVVDLLEQVREPKSEALHIDLALGVSRGERMDYAIQKSTELGVAGITPIYSQRGEVRIKQAARLENKLRHWRRIAVNACEQSGRLSVPTVNEPRDLASWMNLTGSTARLLLDPRGRRALDESSIGDSISLLVGPEGGFAGEEVRLAQRQGFTVVSLGPRILRTETAPLAAISILQHLYGDM